jgi:hypothetical protein
LTAYVSDRRVTRDFPSPCPEHELLWLIGKGLNSMMVKYNRTLEDRAARDELADEIKPFFHSPGYA